MRWPKPLGLLYLRYREELRGRGVVTLFCGTRDIWWLHAEAMLMTRRCMPSLIMRARRVLGFNPRR
jgi:hypothetical protein